MFRQPLFHKTSSLLPHNVLFKYNEIFYLIHKARKKNFFWNNSYKIMNLLTVTDEKLADVVYGA